LILFISLLDKGKHSLWLPTNNNSPPICAPIGQSCQQLWPHRQ